MAYNRDQWIDSFENALLRLRPQMYRRVLASVALLAWTKYGRVNTDPAVAAKNWSKLIDGKGQ